jgi:Rieske Fe-S protein
MAEHLSFARQYATYAGKTLGAYYLEQQVEQLETGPVFLARQQGQRYRLRFLALPAALTPEERLLYLGHFQREAGLVAALQHAALLPLSDYGIFEGAPYLVWPDLSLVSFQQGMARNGPMDARLLTRYLDAMAAGLEYAHQRGVLHLNLNARNVLLNPAGQVLIAETGLVRMLGSQVPAVRQVLELENATPLLRDQQGRVLYGLSLASAPAPEVLLAQPPGATSDVYALGALLYFLLTGHRVMRASTLAELADLHLHAAPPSLTPWRQDLPAQLDDLLHSALAKAPERRPRSVRALAEAYASIVTPEQSGRSVFVPPVAPVTLPAAPVRTPPAEPPARGTSLSRRRALTLLATGGGVAAAAGVTLWIAGHRGAWSAPVSNAGANPTSGNTSQSGASQSSAGASSSPAHSGRVLAHVSDVPANSARTFALANSDNPGLLIHLPDNHFVAFNTTCTHAGCAVAYNQQSHLLLCPCHGASFDPARKAAVVSGPAPAPLTAIAITVNQDGTITTNA